MDELREKLIAQDAGLDDRFVELLKVLLVYEHPFLLSTPRLRLSLINAAEDTLEFSAAYEHSERTFKATMPRAVADKMILNRDSVLKWTRDSHREGVFDLSDKWVSIWRWSPQPTALDRLREFAQAAREGQAIDTDSTAFKQMLSGIPRGTQLPSWAKRDLRSIFDYAKANALQVLEDQLFEIRFDLLLSNDWSTNDDVNDIDTLWMLLKDLPDTNVEGNTKIHELNLIAGGGGWYSPTSYDIAIGSEALPDQEYFEDVVRHEVGHSVHEMWSDLVDDWLANQFGWLVYGTTDSDIDAWVGHMGGWGAMSADQCAESRSALRANLGKGSSWNPGPKPKLPIGHPWFSTGFGPRLALERTGASWYRNFKSWHMINGKAFFLNYWYRTLMVVDAATLDLIASMPSNYAAMSHFEFFAELYALYYDLNDPLRVNVPADVAAWFDANTGAPQADAPMPAGPAQKEEWEIIDRPVPV